LVEVDGQFWKRAGEQIVTKGSSLFMIPGGPLRGKAGFSLRSFVSMIFWKTLHTFPDQAPRLIEKTRSNGSLVALAVTGPRN